MLIFPIMVKIGNIQLGERPLIAVPLTDNDIASLDSIHDADIIECRIDMFSDLSLKNIKTSLKNAKKKFNVPIIATLRLYSEGGAKNIAEDKRLKIFQSVSEIADAIDIELNSDIANHVISLALESGITAIASYHDFSITPSMRDLVSILKKGKDTGAHIVKIAVMANTYDDIRTITEFTLRHYEYNIVTIAMGEIGITSRFFLPFIGSLFTFATIKTQSAPGQISLDELKSYFKSGLF